MNKILARKILRFAVGPQWGLQVNYNQNPGREIENCKIRIDFSKKSTHANGKISQK